jgi:hypothetical protein
MKFLWRLPENAKLSLKIVWRFPKNPMIPKRDQGGSMTDQNESTQLLSIPESPGAAGGSNINRPAYGMGADLGGVLPGSNMASQVLTHDVHLVDQKKPASSLTKAVLAIFLVAGGLFAYLWLETGEMPDILKLVGLSDEGSEVVVSAPAPKQNPVTPPSPPSAPVVNSSGPSSPSKSASKSIWDNIENELGSDLPELAEQLTVDQEEAFRAKLGHEFNYQRYQGVLDLAASRARGSEDMLREALESKKLWTRMRALMGLADLGEEISADEVQLALGSTHSELRARFFERFEKSPCSPGCYFVARATLPYLDALGRAEVIRVIARESSAVRDLYLVAATYDQADLVKKAAADWLDKNSVDGAVYEEVKKAFTQ